MSSGLRLDWARKALSLLRARLGVLFLQVKMNRRSESGCRGVEKD
jgi:hypothetical protein